MALDFKTPDRSSEVKLDAYRFRVATAVALVGSQPFPFDSLSGSGSTVRGYLRKRNSRSSPAP